LNRFTLVRPNSCSYVMLCHEIFGTDLIIRLYGVCLAKSTLSYYFLFLLKQSKVISSLHFYNPSIYFIDLTGWLRAKALPRHEPPHQLDSTCPSSSHHKSFLREPENTRWRLCGRWRSDAQVSNKNTQKSEKICSEEPY